MGPATASIRSVCLAACAAALAGAACGCANAGGGSVQSTNAAPPALGSRAGQVQRAAVKTPDWDLLGLTRSSPRPQAKGRPDWDLLGLTSPQPRRNIKITPRRREPSLAERWDEFCGGVRRFFGLDKARPLSVWPGAPGPEDFRPSLPGAPALAPARPQPGPVMPPPQSPPPE